jgi:hypothetical protein
LNQQAIRRSCLSVTGKYRIDCCRERCRVVARYGEHAQVTADRGLAPTILVVVIAAHRDIRAMKPCGEIGE